MSDEKTLLPCPICGGQPDFQHFNITPKVKGRIICACGIELRQGENETEDDIRIIWNTRATLGSDLQTENAKLRELVRHLRECTRHNVCAACKYVDDACDFDYDMRELGVDA